MPLKVGRVYETSTLLTNHPYRLYNGAYFYLNFLDPPTSLLTEKGLFLTHSFTLSPHSLSLFLSLSLCIYIYIYIYTCAWVCVCGDRERERERELSLKRSNGAKHIS